MRTPLAHLAQVADLKVILPLVPERRRVAVCAAFLGIGVVDIYKAAGLSHGTLSYWRRRCTRVPLGAMAAIALAIGLDVRDLFDESEGIPPAMHAKPDERWQRKREPSLPAGEHYNVTALERRRRA